MGASIPPSTLRQALEPWCAVGVTGALRVEDPPGGAIYLHGGRLTYAECGLVSGVDKLLTASGRVPPEVWRAAVAAGRSSGRIGDSLVEDGHITRNELALSALSTLMDAAFFLFDAAVSAQFEPDVVNPLGLFCEMEFAAVCAEVDRRRRVLTDVWPDPDIDTAAVVPARRLRGHQVSLTAAQWEIVANADRRRSPADLARLLGRETFVMLLEARRLARAGLIEPGRPGGSAVAESVAAVRARTAAALVRAGRDRQRPDTRPAEVRHAEVARRDGHHVDSHHVDNHVDGHHVDNHVDGHVDGQRADGQHRGDNRRGEHRRDPVDARSAVPLASVPRVTASVPMAAVAVPDPTADGRGRRTTDPEPGPGGPVSLPRREIAEHRPAFPAFPTDRPPVEECSDSTLMRISRALRALR